MKPTLRQVAERSGVSEATVSRVLNRRPGVSEATHAAVLRAVEELGYQHGYGHRLRPATPPATIGILVPEFDNPVFPLYARALERELARRDLMVGVCSSTLETTEERAHVHMLVARGVAGLVFVYGVHADTTADLDHYRQLLERAMPMVFVGGFVDGLAAPFLATDERSAARTSVRHLADLGHRRIGLAVGPARYTPSQRWCEGFSQGMDGHFGGAAPAPRAEAVYSIEGGRAAGDRLLDHDVTGVVAASDMMALGVVQAARARGLDVPGDVSVVGYDDSPLMACTDPPLTTLRQPLRAIARAATGALTHQLRGRAPQGGEERLFPAELVVRGSTSPPRQA